MPPKVHPFHPIPFTTIAVHKTSTMSSATTAQPSQNQDRLRSHFIGHDASNYAQRWDSLWSEGTFLPWDRGHANPALIDTLTQRGHDLLPRPQDDNKGGKRARALVPGCGKGYDVALFAAHGYDAYGLEISEHAVKAAEKYLADPGEGPLEGEYKVKGQTGGMGETKCVLADFFADAWLEQVGGLGQGFDIIYDNTVSALKTLGTYRKSAKDCPQC